MNNSNDDFNIYISSDVTSSIDQTNMSSITISGDANSPVYTISLNDTIDLSGVSVSTLNSIDTNSYNNWIFSATVPFEDGFPEWTDFQEMCKEYPGLEKTFEHMKVFYKMCKDDWEAKKRGDND
jgi:hypothetical protein